MKKNEQQMTYETPEVEEILFESEKEMLVSSECPMENDDINPCWDKEA